MKGKDYDKILRIKTEGEQAGFNSSFHYHRYEPTPYEYLTSFFEEYQLKKTDCIVDFGSGKGRLLFLLHHLFQTKGIGIEMNEEFYTEALSNKWSYFGNKKKKKNKFSFSYVKQRNIQSIPMIISFISLTLFLCKSLIRSSIIFYCQRSNVSETSKSLCITPLMSIFTYWMSTHHL